MSNVPTAVAKRLATLSRQMRRQSLLREEQDQAFRAGEMTRREQQDALSRALSCKQIAQRRLQAAVEACDVDAAERELQTLLSYTARIKGLTQSPQVELPLAA